MTELNTYPETEPDRAGVSWPAAPAFTGNADPNPESDAVNPDGSVAMLLHRLAEVPGLPVSLHAAAYDDLHDALLEALNEDDPSSQGDA
jgi:hypothetical protein